MKVGDYCKRTLVSIASDMDLVEAAKVMRDEHVGFLVVYLQGDEVRKPAGVLTDRDVVLQVTAKEVDPHSVSVADVMTRQPLIASESDELSEVLQAMRMAGIRRVPVVNVRGGMCGIFAMDDALDLITGMMCDVTGSIKSEQRQEWRARSA
jgi:predicted transcriptional regulator